MVTVTLVVLVEVVRISVSMLLAGLVSWCRSDRFMWGLIVLFVCWWLLFSVIIVWFKVVMLTLVMTLLGVGMGWTIGVLGRWLGWLTRLCKFFRVVITCD